MNGKMLKKFLRNLKKIVSELVCGIMHQVLCTHNFIFIVNKKIDFSKI